MVCQGKRNKDWNQDRIKKRRRIKAGRYRKRGKFQPWTPSSRPPSGYAERICHIETGHQHCVGSKLCSRQTQPHKPKYHQYIPFLQTHASDLTSSGLTTTAPTETTNATSNNLLSTSTRFPCDLSLLPPPPAALATSFSELRTRARARSAPSSTARNPFLGRRGGAGNPFRTPVLSSSASVPLSLDVRDQ